MAVKEQQRLLDEEKARREQARQAHAGVSSESVTSYDIDCMTGDEYRRRLSDPVFVTRVNEIEAARKPKPTRA